MKRLWLIQAAGNALLFWCAFTWLGLRDSKTTQLIETAIFGLLILVPWLWLQDGTMAYCGDRSQGLWPAFRKGAKNLAAFAVVVLVFALLFWALGKLAGPFASAGQRTASWLTFHVRKPFKPDTWARAFLAVLWGVRSILLPVLMLPMAAGAANHGVKGLSRMGGKVFGLQYIVALLAGFYLPGLLMHWVPRLTETTAQVLSFGVRFGLAYVLIITSWLALSFFAARRAA